MLKARVGRKELLTVQHVDLHLTGKFCFRDQLRKQPKKDTKSL